MADVSLDVLTTILQLAPSQEEANAFQNYQGDTGALFFTSNIVPIK